MSGFLKFIPSDVDKNDTVNICGVLEIDKCLNKLCKDIFSPLLTTEGVNDIDDLFPTIFGKATESSSETLTSISQKAYVIIQI